MTTQPYDLDDLALETVTGGGAPTAGKLGMALPTNMRVAVQHAVEATELTSLAGTLFKAMETQKADPTSLNRNVGAIKSALTTSIGQMQNAGISAGDIKTTLMEALHQATVKEGAVSKGSPGDAAVATSTVGFIVNQILSPNAVDGTKPSTDPSKGTLPGSGASNGLGGAIGQIGAGHYSSNNDASQASAAGADQKTNEASAQQAQMLADNKEVTLEKIDELAKMVEDFLHNMKESNNDMMAAITRA